MIDTSIALGKAQTELGDSANISLSLEKGDLVVELTSNHSDGRAMGVQGTVPNSDFHLLELHGLENLTVFCEMVSSMSELSKS